MFKLVRNIVIVILLLLAGTAAWMYYLQPAGEYNVLLLGADEVEKYSRHSDTIILASCNLKDKKLTFMSIPRDSLVTYNGKKMKINTVYASNYFKGGHYKSCDEVRKTAEKITGVSIPYFIQMDYGAVKETVDLFEGVKINIAKKMKYTDHAAGLFIDFQPGPQILSGEDAVKYLRFRSDAAADIGRIDRQQKFVVAFLEKAKAKMSVEKIPHIYGIIKKNVNTNVPVKDIIKLYKAYRDFRISEAKRYTLPGEPERISGILYWNPDVLQGRKMLRGNDKK